MEREIQRKSRWKRPMTVETETTRRGSLRRCVALGLLVA
jgi:hypothetical protein